MKASKTGLVGMALIVFAWSTAQGSIEAQAPQANKTAFNLSAKQVFTDSTKRIIDCPNHKVTCQTTTVEISLMNLTATNLSFKTEWYFVAKRADTGDKVLFGTGEKTVDLKAAGSTAFKVSSGTLYQHAPFCAEAKMNRGTDAIMLGYIVRATAADGSLNYFTTLPALKECVSVEASFQKLKADSDAWETARPKAK